MCIITVSMVKAKEVSLIKDSIQIYYPDGLYHVGGVRDLSSPTMGIMLKANVDLLSWGSNFNGLDYGPVKSSKECL